MTERDSKGEIDPSRRRKRRRPTGSLEPLPDTDRISSIGTVRARKSESQLRAEREALAEVEAGAEDSDPTAQPARRTGRRRAITKVWKGRDLKRVAGDDDETTIAERYRVVEKLGAGGMSEIYRVQHVHMNKEFALKVIETTPALEPRMRQLFLREAQTASQLDHPNIVQVIDFGVDERHGAFLVMEYLKGETLYDRLKREGRLKVHQALQIALQVAEALHHMHGVDVIHCDVKAENVFLCRATSEARSRLQVKMIDFGLSRPRTQNVKLADVEVGGTPQYMAPELINGESPQPTMDIYSLGILLYEMLTGAVPFVGTLDDVIDQQLHKAPMPPSRRMEEHLESRIEQVILEMLDKDPTARQASMGQVIFQLRTVMAMYDLPGAPKRRTTGEAPAVSKSRVRIYQPLVELSPFPIFQLDTKGRLTYANPSFCHFVQETLDKLRGVRISSTRLALVFPSVQTDVQTCVKQADEDALQRAFSFELKDGTKNVMLCWLQAQLGKRGEVERVNGYIHPIS